MVENERSQSDHSESRKHLDAGSELTFTNWRDEWQNSARLTQSGDKSQATRASDLSHVPSLEIISKSEQVHNVTVHNDKNGRSDTVAGINPVQGESLGHLIKRLHPNLSDEQLAKEEKKVLKYNHDYGNDLGDGYSLDASKAVFLTSVKYTDAGGRITRIEGPTGRVTELSYDSAGLSGYKISEADGRTVEAAQKNSRGQFEVSRDGRASTAASVAIDMFGDITVTGTDGNKVGHLTRGDDVYTHFKGGQPTESATVRNGETQVIYQFEAAAGGYKIYACDPSNPDKRVLITPEYDEESEKRIVLALGNGPKAYAELSKKAEPDSGDIAPDQYMASNIVKAAVASADAHHSTGWCYAGVADALDKIGVHLTGERAYMAKDQLLNDRRFARASIDDLRPGDVLVHGATSRHRSGHIAVYLGRGQEASDHIQSLITGEGYGGTTVFRFVGAKS